jgi:hypothetical protein
MEGPSTSLVFLGIEIDSVNEELRLPHSKLLSLKQILARWVQKHSATKHEFQILLGHLNHAATVIPAGKPFLILTSAPLRRSSHQAWLNLQCTADIE